MSAPADVLAVMEEAELALMDFNCSVTWDRARKARAAVAELIEAADDASRVQIARPNDMGRAKKIRLRAAVARAKGGAA